jgi:hypothetical protein
MVNLHVCNPVDLDHNEVATSGVYGKQQTSGCLTVQEGLAARGELRGQRALKGLRAARSGLTCAPACFEREVMICQVGSNRASDRGSNFVRHVVLHFPYPICA